MSKPNFSRRSFLSLAAASAATIPFMNEPMLAAAARRSIPHPPLSKDAVMIDYNENPLGPSDAARRAVADMIPLGGRYCDSYTEELLQTFARQEGVGDDQFHMFAGSTVPLYGAVVAHTSPQKSYVTADPGYEAGVFTASVTGARVVKVPLTKTYAHDVKAMIAAAPDAGLFYLCSPNNPTGTLTPLADIAYLIDNKPTGSVVVVDEAYTHFTETPSAIEFVKAGKDLIVLRTMSKAYGMAGLRCGFAIARPDLLTPILNHTGDNFMPVPAVVAALASLKDPQLVAERRRINAANRQETFAWLDRNQYSYIPSQSNCFLLDTKRPGRETIEAMAKEDVYIGRVWPSYPNHARITVGTHDEMGRFQEAFKKVMTGAVAFSVGVPRVRRMRGSLLS
ncbi:MAG TPA: pyridoxal phosphate-dependent aminotransferase [Terriglobales bacterium]|jgi:histidinol-phosphate aminotransferase|nr:pyridoxal phosphate-dependent aminotransferase [Terriglobales bacterium]